MSGALNLIRMARVVISKVALECSATTFRSQMVADFFHDGRRTVVFWRIRSESRVTAAVEFDGAVGALVHDVGGEAHHAKSDDRTPRRPRKPNGANGVWRMRPQ
jgi:hypothetical protein